MGDAIAWRAVIGALITVNYVRVTSELQKLLLRVKIDDYALSRTISHVSPAANNRTVQRYEKMNAILQP